MVVALPDNPQAQLELRRGSRRATARAGASPVATCAGSCGSIRSCLDAGVGPAGAVRQRGRSRLRPWPARRGPDRGGSWIGSPASTGTSGCSPRPAGSGPRGHLPPGRPAHGRHPGSRHCPPHRHPLSDAGRGPARAPAPGRGRSPGAADRARVRPGPGLAQHGRLAVRGRHLAGRSLPPLGSGRCHSPPSGRRSRTLGFTTTVEPCWGVMPLPNVLVVARRR